jgi:tRNA(fMet)-specific endonuclease VapC
MYALDTNTLIYFFRGTGRVKEHMLSVAPSDIAIPSVVLFELEVGISRSGQRSKRRAHLDALLEVVHVLPLDASSAKRAAEVSTSLAAAGALIGPMDTLIAGIALANAATLVTHNTGEFRRVRGLALEDWFV